MTPYEILALGGVFVVAFTLGSFFGYWIKGD